MHMSGSWSNPQTLRLLLPEPTVSQSYSCRPDSWTLSTILPESSSAHPVRARAAVAARAIQTVRAGREPRRRVTLTIVPPSHYCASREGVEPSFPRLRRPGRLHQVRPPGKGRLTPPCSWLPRERLAACPPFL